MLNKVILSVCPIIALLWVACANENVAGGTIDPNTIAENSSTSADVDVVLSSSSAEANVARSSSSSVTQKAFSSEAIEGPVLLHARNFSIQCIVDVIYVDLDAPAASADVGAPVAYKQVEGDSVNVALQGVYFDIPCDAEKQEDFIKYVNESGPIVGFEADTLYVNFSRNKGAVYDCSCAANTSFTLDKNYSDFNYTVFDQMNALLVQTR